MENSEPSSLLVVLQERAFTLDNSLSSSKGWTKSYMNQQFHSREMKTYFAQKLYNVYKSINYHSQKVETTQVFINWWMDK